MKNRSLLLLSASLISLAVAGPMAAKADADAPSQAKSNNEGLEEVVVTAQKRTEKLSDLTVTASVVNAEALQRENITDIADLNKLVPAANLNGTFNGRVPLGMRGISSDSNEGAVGVASGVGIMVDGISVPSDSFAANSIEDVIAVEVLEGPQATLGGRTASSGVIQFRTHQPTTVWQGDLTGTITGDNEKHIVGSISGPISDRVSFSVTGWDHYTRFPVQNVDTGDYSHQEEFGGRAKVKVALTDNLDATVMGRASSTESSGFNFAYSYVYPGAYILAGPSGGPPFWSQAALFPSSIHIGPENTQFASPVTGVFEHRYDTDGSLNLEYRLGEYTLTSTTAYQQELRSNSQDLFAVDEYFGNIAAAALGAPLAFNNMQTGTITTKQWSEEAKIVSPIDRTFSFVAGVFYSDTDVIEHGVRRFAPAYEDSIIHPDTKTTAFYAHGTYKLFTDTSIVGGVRFNYDDLNYDINQGGNPTPGFAPVAPFHSSGSHTSTSVVGDIGIKQQLTPTSQVYGTYTRGYAPEVYNTAFTLVSNTPLKPIGQENINSFEIGTKGHYFDNTLELNVSAFDTIYQNYQVQSFVSIPGSPIGINDLTAAGEAETRGVEISTKWRPFSMTTLGFSTALINAKFNKYDNAPCYWSGPATMLPSSCFVSADGTFHTDASGKPMPNAPKTKFTVTADQRVPLGSLPYEVDFAGSVSYRSGAEMQPDQNPYAYQAAYTLVNMSATLMHEDGAYSLSVFVNNVFDKHYNVDVEDFWASPWGSNAVVVQPGRDTNRYFGVKANYNF